MPRNDRQKVQARHDAIMKEVDQSWLDHWKELASYMLPRRGQFRGDQPNRGDKRNQKIINAAATYALRVSAAGMFAGTTSPNWPWAKIRIAGDVELGKFGPHREWLSQVERELYSRWWRSNFYRVAATVTKDVLTFGTAGVFLEDKDTDLHFVQFPIGSFGVENNEQGDVDVIARSFKYKVSQMIEKFGEENLSRSTQAMIENDNMSSYIEVMHLIEPNDKRLEMQKEIPRKFRSLWWEKEANEDEWLRIGGFDEFPAMMPRWEVNAADAYGSDCPGMQELPNVKMLQKLERAKMESLEKSNRPPLWHNTGMNLSPISIAPGATNPIPLSSGGRPGIGPIFQTNPNLTDYRQEIAEVVAAINRGFFADLFITLLAGQNAPPQKTAFEVAAIQGEKLLMLGPVLERLHNDWLRPTVERSFAIGQRNEWFPEPPPDLVDQSIDVEFVSTLAQAQRAANVIPIERGMQFIGGMAALYPEARHVVDPDVIVRQYWQLLGADPEAVRDDDAVAAIRAQEERLAQMAAMGEAAGTAKTGAEAAKVLSETDVTSDSALQRIVTGSQVSVGR